MDLPADFRKTITRLYGARGREWLRNLPALIARYEARWSITAQKPFANLSYNYVTPATSKDGQPVILKLGLPNPELLSEIDALEVFDGQGAARLLACDRQEGALLVERLLPGTPLTGLCIEDDERATSIAVSVMQALWRPAPSKHTLPTVSRWAQGLGRLRTHFEGGTGPLPERLVARAEALFRVLLSSMDEPVLLHGDLHHDNILAAGATTWKAIDPKGILGEPAYEVGALLRNPFPTLLSMPQPKLIITRRLNLLSDGLGLDRQRLLDWAVAQAVLSAWWCIEDRLPCWQGMIACAELMAQLG